MEVMEDWLKQQLSLYREQVIAEYDNLKGSKFRMGYEAGRKETLEEVERETIISFCNLVRNELKQQRLDGYSLDGTDFDAVFEGAKRFIIKKII